MSTCMRREISREITGPTEEEFRAEGATFLVGMIRPAYPNRIAPQYAVTPVDRWFYPFQYIDDIGVRVGDLSPSVGDMLGKIFGQKKSAEQVLADAQAKAGRKLARVENQTLADAKTLIAWMAKNGFPIEGTWAVPNNDRAGHGALFTALDDVTVKQIREKARQIAKGSKTYFSIVTQGPNRYLAAFVSDPKHVPVSYNAAVVVADAITDPEIDAIDLFKTSPGEVTVAPADPSDPAAVMGIFDKIKSAFGPKKPEKIEKKIAKLEEQLAYWKGKLAEAKAGGDSSDGFLHVGNVNYGMMGRMGVSRMFSAAEERGRYGSDAPDDIAQLFGPAEIEGRGRYGYEPGDVEDLFDPAEDVDYGAGALEDREDLEDAAAETLHEAYDAGLLTKRSLRRALARISSASDEALLDLVEEGEDDETPGDEAGLMAARPMSMQTAARPMTAPGSSGGASRGRGRVRRRIRRRVRRNLRQQGLKPRRVRRVIRRRVQNRQARRQAQAHQTSDPTGAESSAPPPKIIRRTVTVPAPSSFDANPGDDEYEEIIEESEGFAYGGPGYGDAALRLGGRSLDLPRSPNGMVITYPV